MQRGGERRWAKTQGQLTTLANKLPSLLKTAHGGHTSEAHRSVLAFSHHFRQLSTIGPQILPFLMPFLFSLRVLFGSSHPYYAVLHCSYTGRLWIRLD